MVRELLSSYYPERFNLLDAGDAWRLLMNTSRYDKNQQTSQISQAIEMGKKSHI